MFAHRKPTCLSILGFLAATIACVACDAQAQQKVSPAKLKAITRMLQQEVDAKRIPRPTGLGCSPEANPGVTRL